MHGLTAPSPGRQMLLPPGSNIRPPAEPSAIVEARAAQHTPFWMDVTQQPSAPRTGASAAKDSGLQMIAFFALITIMVGAAGFFGIAMWGPEKPIKNRTHLAT